jgi:hypothetical protein
MNLSQLFAQNRFEVIADDKLSNPGRYQPVASQSWLAGIQEYAYQ